MSRDRALASDLVLPIKFSEFGQRLPLPLVNFRLIFVCYNNVARHSLAATSGPSAVFKISLRKVYFHAREYIFECDARRS